MIKQPGGVLCPATPEEADRMTRFRTNGQYTAEIKTTRNPIFHRKMFAFLNYCFEFWAAEQAGLGCLDEYTQREVFRKKLTVLAGFYKEVIDPFNGGIVLVADSLAYGNMDDEEFERCYNAMINAALRTVFAGVEDQNIYQKLYSFF